HIPKHFEQHNVGAMHDLMQTHPFATLVTTGADGLSAVHIPTVLAREPQPYGLIKGHVARTNPVWRTPPESEVMMIFHGPHAYISPSWYPSKQETGKVVPTWNYVVVHAYGKVRAIEDSKWLKDNVEQLTAQQEAGFEHPWTVSDAPEDYTEKLLSAIVGIELTITRLAAQWK